MLMQFDVPLESRKTSWIKYVVIFTMFTEVIICIYNLFTTKVDAEISHYFYGFSFQKQLGNVIVSSLLDIFQLIVISMPMLSFSFFYIAVCSDVRSIIKYFKNFMLNKTIPKYKELFYNYYAIKSAADKIDNTVGFLVFTTVIHNSCVMFFSVDGMVGSNMVQGYAIDYYWYLSNFVLFIVMTASAASVSEASAEVASSALILPEEKGSSNWNQHRFITLVEKEITFTVWKLAPIRRNFIFGISGILFTYSLMIHSLSPVKSDSHFAT
ncbi:uncharacterized protein NPIL_138931 [Nephila pilipes]|uniref:Gustatory receptor n=1 Tax=Nephila pilipes TaxID=299642 RepID=A0A8X6NXE2_NEPPI|nr:uncharacterized protein NPIL_138931 [Nephila pilipes]